MTESDMLFSLSLYSQAHQHQPPMKEAKHKKKGRGGEGKEQGVSRQRRNTAHLTNQPTQSLSTSSIAMHAHSCLLMAFNMIEGRKSGAYRTVGTFSLLLRCVRGRLKQVTKG